MCPDEFFTAALSIADAQKLPSRESRENKVYLCFAELSRFWVSYTEVRCVPYNVLAFKSRYTEASEISLAQFCSR